MFYRIFSIFWFIREVKTVLFWLYLWQLKEYHIGRFIDHFRTQKGKKLIWNELLILKTIFLVGFTFFPLSDYNLAFFLVVFFLYFLESGKFFYDLFRGKLRKPIFTIKTLFLLGVSIFIVLSFLLGILSGDLVVRKLLFFDLLTPLVVSCIVLLFQPLAVVWRNIIIYKAKKRREKFKNLLVIGITGSYGKTSTKEFLYKILSKKFNVLKTEKHQNAEIGIANCILKDLKKEHEIFIVEMGAYNKGGIKLLCDIAQPEIGILTGLNKQHLATFGSFKNIIKTKFELIESLPKGGIAILNGSNKVIWDLKSQIRDFNSDLGKILYCSLEKEKADFYIESLREKKKSVSFDLVGKDLKLPIKLNLLGQQNVENLLLAICCAQELEMSLKEIARICNNISDLFGTMQLREGVKGSKVIDSTYSSNPTGVISHLNYLKKWKGKKAIIMPCLIELGESSSENHRKIGAKIGEVCDLAIITTREKFGDIQKGAVAQGMNKDQILFFKEPGEIFYKIKDFIQEGDIILLEGRVSKNIKRLLIKNES